MEVAAAIWPFPWHNWQRGLKLALWIGQAKVIRRKSMCNCSETNRTKIGSFPRHNVSHVSKETDIHPSEQPCRTCRQTWCHTTGRLLTGCYLLTHLPLHTLGTTQNHMSVYSRKYIHISSTGIVFLSTSNSIHSINSVLHNKPKLYTKRWSSRY